MKGDNHNDRTVSRRTLLRRLGVGTALVGGGVAGLSSGAAASHTDEPEIDIPDPQTARDHPRFNAVIQINSAYLPEGGYINVKNANDDCEVDGQSIIELPAGHFRNASVVVQTAPDDESCEVTAVITRDQAGEEPYRKDGSSVSDTGTVEF
jgi:hypothetical protein